VREESHGSHPFRSGAQSVSGYFLLAVEANVIRFTRYQQIEKRMRLMRRCALQKYFCRMLVHVRMNRAAFRSIAQQFIAPTHARHGAVMFR
jgi:hypothetical protein